jgi:hypothetical protein
MKRTNHHAKPHRTHYTLTEMQTMLGAKRGRELFQRGENWIARPREIKPTPAPSNP